MQLTGHQLAVCLTAVMPRSYRDGDFTLMMGVCAAVSIFSHWTYTGEHAAVSYWDLHMYIKKEDSMLCPYSSLSSLAALLCLN